MIGLRAITLMVAAALLGAACSGSSNGNAAAPTTTERATTTRPNPEVHLREAVRKAVLADHEMSVRVLWTNAVPARPTATAGPALEALRESAADRRRRGIRVRLTDERFRIVSINLDPSYARATAVVTDFQQAQPYGRDGQPLGRAVVLNERVQLHLRRVGTSTRFVVWEVVPLR